MSLPGHDLRTARLIGARQPGEGALLRREVILDRGHGDVVEARWWLSAHGVVEGSVNGLPASADLLEPGWSSYEWRLRFREHDVLDQVRQTPDRLVLGLVVGHGWFAGRLGWFGDREVYGDRLGAVGELTLVFDDGHRQVVATDAGWRLGTSPIRSDDLYDGQHIDARLQPVGWQQPGFDDSAWPPAEELPFDATRLVPARNPPIRRQAEIAPRRIWTSPSGRTLVDFGQNLVGWVRARIRAEAGTTVVLRHAEVLADGELDPTSLRSAAATDTFVCAGLGAEEVFEPTFTCHGFRYAEVTGWPGVPGADDLRAIVVSSQLERTGFFECSDELLNRFHANVVRGMRGNFVGVPTDCPQRDERLGYTGDLAVFAATAAFLFDTSDFVRDWLRDVRAAQQAYGPVPFFAPDVRRYFPPDPVPAESTAVWGDAAVWIPWTLWLAHGDRDALAEAYPGMVDHVRRVAGLLDPVSGCWESGFQFGDWLDPRAPEDTAQGRADRGVVATACAHRSAILAAASARALGAPQDEAEFSAQATRLRTAFQRRYVDGHGVIVSDCETVYALAIVFDLLEPDQRRAAGDRLVALVRTAGHTAGTGFVGTPFICDALTAVDHEEDAYALLMNRECPGWLYPVTMGATTVWERWDGIRPDGTPHPSTMNSFNHYAFGAVADWMHRHLGGIAPAAPGYRRIRIAPRPGGGVSHARTELRIATGVISVAWRLSDDQLQVDVTLPPGVTADIHLPGDRLRTVDGPAHWHGGVTRRRSSGSSGEVR